MLQGRHNRELPSRKREGRTENYHVEKGRYKEHYHVSEKRYNGGLPYERREVQRRTTMFEEGK